MNLSLIIKAVLLILIIPATLVTGEINSATNKKAIQFNGQSFYYRWSDKNQHEFTPKGQQDLSKWEDMMTINHYPKIVYDDKLLDVANSTYTLYKKHGGVILKVDTRPKTRNSFAEYYITAVFHYPKYSEAVFVKFSIKSRIGTASIYSHRIHGENVQETMDLWIKVNGLNLETKLESWTDIPSEIKLLEMQNK